MLIKLDYNIMIIVHLLASLISYSDPEEVNNQQTIASESLTRTICIPLNRRSGGLRMDPLVGLLVHRLTWPTNKRGFDRLTRKYLYA